MLLCVYVTACAFARSVHECASMVCVCDSCEIAYVAACECCSCVYISYRCVRICESCCHADVYIRQSAL